MKLEIRGEKINLTKNERRTLKCLLDNSRISDSEIASKLKISSQAVGKIRRKLEKTVIRSYGATIDYSKLGINTFAIAIARITSDGKDKGELEIEQLLQDNHHIINVYRLPKGSSTHVLVYGFKDINQFDNFFHSTRVRDELHKFLEIQDLFTFSHNSLIKENAIPLFHNVIDNLNKLGPNLRFEEIERFKNKIR